jgi:hypothetical protein
MKQISMDKHHNLGGKLPIRDALPLIEASSESRADNFMYFIIGTHWWGSRVWISMAHNLLCITHNLGIFVSEMHWHSSRPAQKAEHTTLCILSLVGTRWMKQSVDKHGSQPFMHHTQSWDLPVRDALALIEASTESRAHNFMYFIIGTHWWGRDG